MGRALAADPRSDQSSCDGATTATCSAVSLRRFVALTEAARDVALGVLSLRLPHAGVLKHLVLELCKVIPNGCTSTMFRNE